MAVRIKEKRRKGNKSALDKWSSACHNGHFLGSSGEYCRIVTFQRHHIVYFTRGHADKTLEFNLGPVVRNQNDKSVKCIRRGDFNSTLPGKRGGPSDLDYTTSILSWADTYFAPDETSHNRFLGVKRAA